MKLTVNEYCEKFNVSRVSVYNWLSSGKLDSIKEGKNRFIVVKNDVNDSKDSVNMFVNDCKECIKKDLEIKRLNDLLIEKENEIRNLFNRLIDVEKDSKKELKEIVDKKDLLLKNYMDMMNRYSENILSNINSKNLKNSNIDINEDVIDVNLDDRKFMSLKDFRKLMKKKKGWETKDIVNFINKRINKKDDYRFLRENGVVKIIEDSFDDL